MKVTQGISPKAILAGVLPALGTVLAVVITGWVTGDFDKLELAEAVIGLSSAILAAFGAWLGNPGTVVVVSAARSMRRREAGQSLVEALLIILVVVVIIAVIFRPA